MALSEVLSCERAYIMNLIEISANGSPAEEMGDMPTIATEVANAYCHLYKAVGFERPWLGYFARVDTVCVGTCGFKGPPKDNRVEIAYFTFGGHEGRGYATRMARALSERARKAETNVIVAAQTLPCEGASTSILRRLGFALIGTIQHPEDGDVWEWQLRRSAEALT
jgi:[ribosomal protein S5]-alanine N-acetyltransferase